MNKTDRDFLQELERKRSSENSLIAVAFFEKLKSMLDNSQITVIEFDYAKEFILTNTSNIRLPDYERDFINVIPYINNAYRTGKITKCERDFAVKQVLAMRTDMITTKMFCLNIISFNDFKTKDSNTILNIEKHNFGGFGYKSPYKVAVNLIEDYNFSLISAHVSSRKQIVMLKRSDLILTLSHKFGIFSTTSKIIDNYGNKFNSHIELFKWLNKK